MARSPDSALGQPIALGRTAEIYPWAERWVLKLFYEWYPRGAAAYEARIARAVHAAGLPVPAVGRLVEVEGRTGLEYGRVDGVPMLQRMRARPWTVSRSARLLAELHAGIHAIGGIEGLPTVPERLERRIRDARGLGAERREAVLAVLRRMPAGDRLCHGDFHPQNVILAAEGPVVIDWIDAMVGNPWADVTRTVMLMEEAIAVGKMASWVEREIAAWFCGVYKKHYTRLQGGGESAIRAWRAVVAAVRLSEKVEGAESWLREQVDRGLTEASDG